MCSSPYIACAPWTAWMGSPTRYTNTKSLAVRQERGQRAVRTASSSTAPGGWTDYARAAFSESRLVPPRPVGSGCRYWNGANWTQDTAV
jgi:hypothetical protein